MSDCVTKEVISRNSLYRRLKASSDVEQVKRLFFQVFYAVRDLSD